MTPEQLSQMLDEFDCGPLSKEGVMTNVLKAIDYAQSQSITFAIWIADNNYSLHDGFWYEPPMYVHEGTRGMCIATNTNDLYSLFLTHQSQSK